MQLARRRFELAPAYDVAPCEHRCEREARGEDPDRHHVRVTRKPHSSKCRNVELDAVDEEHDGPACEHDRRIDAMLATQRGAGEGHRRPDAPSHYDEAGYSI